MVRANGQRDGVGKTRQLSGAFEHTGAILDPTRVSPYRPAAVAMPQSMRPDTRQHLTACTEPSQEMSSLLKQAEALAALRARLPRARSPAAVNPLRGSFAPLRPLRVTAAADRAGSPCGPARRLARVQQEQEEDSGSRLFVSFIAVDRPRKVHPLAPPGWERRGWRWSDREPLGRTGAGTEFGRHRLFLRPEWIHEREGSKTSTGAGKDARSYRSRH